MIRPWLVIAFILGSTAWASAQQATTCPTRSLTDNSNACATTAFVQAIIGGGGALPTPTANSVFIWDGSAIPKAAQTLPLGITYPSPNITGTIGAAYQTLISSNIAVYIPIAHATGSPTTLYNGLQVGVGTAIPTSEQFGNDTAFIEQGIVGTAYVPSSDSTNNSDIGVSGYGLTDSTTKGAVGVLGMSSCAVSGCGEITGNNEVVSNSPTHWSSGVGFNFQLMEGDQCNPNIDQLTGSTNPTGVLYCYYAVGGGNATNNLGRAFVVDQLSIVTGAKWLAGFQTYNGAAVNGIELGALTGTAGSPPTNSGSQPLVFDSYSSGALKQAEISTDNGGDIIYSPSAGAINALEDGNGNPILQTSSSFGGSDIKFNNLVSAACIGTNSSGLAVAIDCPGGGTAPANEVYAGPTSGSAATPTFRALVTADLPTTLKNATTIPETASLSFGAAFTPAMLPGNYTGTSPWIGIVEDRSSGQCSSDMAGAWPAGNTLAMFCMSEYATSANDPTGIVSGNPRWMILLDENVQNTTAEAVPFGVLDLTYVAGAKTVATNWVIGNNNASVTAAEIEGNECDIQGGGAVTTFGCQEFQVYNGVSGAFGIRFTANGSGTFADGIDFSEAPYSDAAIKLGNAQSVKLAGVSGNPAQMYADSSNDLVLVTGASNKLTLFENDSSTTIATLGATLSEFYQPIQVEQDSIGSTSTDGFVGKNATAAASGAQQWSPRVHFQGQGWKTASTAASEPVDMWEEVQPVQGSSAPTGNLVWSESVNSGSATAIMSLSTGGVLNVLTGFEINGSATSGNVLRGNGTNFVSAALAASDLSNGVTGSGDVVLATSPSISGLTVTSSFTATGLVTNADLAGSIAASKLVGTDIATVGTITSGSWEGTAIAAAYLVGSGATTVAGQTCTLGSTCGLGSITESLSSNTDLNNTSDYFAGPVVAQGSSGTWAAFGTVTLEDTAGSANFGCKLWDGTTVIASAQNHSVGSSSTTTISLSGKLASPAGNLRIDCIDYTSTSGIISYNANGFGTDSTITVVRID